MDTNFSDDFLVKGNFSIKKTSTEYEGNLTKEEGLKILGEEKDKLRELQEKLYADGSQSLLVVLQAMDAAGKDKTATKASEISKSISPITEPQL